MLSTEDKDYVIDKLTDELANRPSPRGALINMFLGTAFSQSLVLEGLAREMATSAVTICIADGWNNDPIWMYRLLNESGLLTKDAKIVDIWQRSKDKPPPAADPLARNILNNTIPFCNRVSLRDKLTALEKPTAQAMPILVVTGDNRSGKSYSSNYIDYFSMVRSTITTYRLALDPDMAMDTNAGNIARDLVSMMSRPLNTIPAFDTNMKKHCKDLANWVLSEASQKPDQHWFILDNFKETNLRPDIREFLLVLSDQITNGNFKSKCRLILIGVDLSMLTVDPGRIDEEIVQPCRPSDIQNTVAEIIQRALPFILNQAKMLEFATTGLPADASKLEVLNWRLRVMLHAVLRLKELLAAGDVDYETFLLQMLQQLPDGKKAMDEVRMRLTTLGESLQTV